MLFQLSPNTPRFQVFRLLNEELIHFIENSVDPGVFRRDLFSQGEVGQAIWENAKEYSERTKRELTRDKFENLFVELHATTGGIRRQLFNVIRDHQNLQEFFNNPNPNILGFLPTPCLSALKAVATHLYCSTKDLQPIKNGAGGTDITTHFDLFRNEAMNGNICKSCGMEELAAFRAGAQVGDQWRSDYDHHLCKSKYPIFAVHPDNLIPLCDVCNQDAKKAKDLFLSKNGNDRLAFYPYSEEARDMVSIEIGSLRDPEPNIKVKWLTTDAKLVDKLETWDEVYEIRSRVEGKFRSLEIIIEDEVNPTDLAHLEAQILDKSRSVSDLTLKRKEWAFWYQKLFHELSQLDIEPFAAKWNFVHRQGADGGEHILNNV